VAGRTCRGGLLQGALERQESIILPEQGVTVHTIRQQMVKNDGRPNYALADFVAPKDSGLTDWLGAFVVTTGIGLDERVAAFEAPTTTIRRSW
jgi:cobalamin-dependent methionine synthase I